ncbi:dihydrolipoamide dehydrogenase [Marinobacter sp. ELB17]|nr:dihydrolipoamide dehydrogenase [Marinobacter sp. ELB17]
MTETVKAFAYPRLAKEHSHQAEPQKSGQSHVQAIAGLYNNRCAGADNHRKQRDKKKRGFGVERVRQKAQAQRRLAALVRCFCSLHVNPSGLGPQALHRDPCQIQSTNHFQNAKQQHRLLNKQPYAQQ